MRYTRSTWRPAYPHRVTPAIAPNLDDLIAATKSSMQTHAEGLGFQFQEKELEHLADTVLARRLTTPQIREFVRTVGTTRQNAKNPQP